MPPGKSKCVEHEGDRNIKWVWSSLSNIQKPGKEDEENED